jgi:hypothetical protein
MKELKKLNCCGNPVTERRVYHEFIQGALKNLEELDTKPVKYRSHSISSNHRNSIPTNQEASQNVTEPKPTITLPPLVKLANAQSSDVKRYNSLIQK